MMRIDSDWLRSESLQRLLACLNQDGAETRIVGGAVRNALLGLDVSDVDLATTTLPDETMTRATKAGFKVVPTGYEHGTISVIAHDAVYEVTTLRSDVESDGRHAKVAFATDWEQDAKRRDFTMNGLYARADGTVIDLVEGMADIKAGTIRFIGDANQRIEEDYLRVLRFFRFFAWYGDGRPDPEGLKACVRHRDGLARLSAERVWSELKKLLTAPDPSRAMLWMRQTGVLSRILPESEKWGIDSIHSLTEAEHAFKWSPEPLLRLASIIPPDVARVAEMATRLKMSGKEKAALIAWTEAPDVRAGISEAALRKALYHHGPDAIMWRLKQATSAEQARENDDAARSLTAIANFSHGMEITRTWQCPVFPVSGKDLLQAGYTAGPKMGEKLKELESSWIESGFHLSREDLLARISG